MPNRVIKSKAVKGRINRKTKVDKKVAKLQKDVKHLKLVEATEKSVDYYSTGAYDPLLITGNIYPLHPSVQTLGVLGLNKPSLVYNHVEVRINLEYKVTAGGATATPYGVLTAGYLRVILLCDMDSDQANPTIIGGVGTESLLDNDGMNSEFNYLLGRNRAMKKRYKILKDRRVEWKTIEQQKGLTLKHRFKNHTAFYSKIAGGVTDYISGQMFLILIPSDALIAYTAAATVKLSNTFQSILDYER